jgi:hypothetical protein
MNRIPALATCLVVLLAACGAPKRAVKTEQELLARRAQVQMFAGAMKAGIMAWRSAPTENGSSGDQITKPLYCFSAKAMAS